MRTIAKPIEMINVMGEEGEIRPIRFKIKDESAESRVVQVENILQTDKAKIAGGLTYTFRCEITINQIRRLCEIRYYPERCQWQLFKV